MSIGFIFWLLMLLAIDNAVWLFVLLFCLGWAVFGFAIQGPGVR